MPRVLLLHLDHEDYLADTLLHGLRTVLGADCVDVPRRDAMYADFPAEARAALYGRGFTVWGRLDPSVDAEVDRGDWLGQVLGGRFDLVVLADVHRNWEPWVALRPHLDRLRAQGTRVAVCDGGDGPVLFPHGPTWWRRALPRPLPRVAGRVPVFKRELTPLTSWVARRPLRRMGVRPIGFSIPEEHLASGEEPKTQLVATHLTDPDIGRLLGREHDRYFFDREADYFADLRASRFATSGRKAGWDALRHYEVTASGCVPLFRGLSRKPATAAPLGLQDGVNAVDYDNPAEVLERIEAMGEAEYARLRAGALEWARRNTTRTRALELLAAVGLGP